MHHKPVDLFDRDAEWAALDRFVYSSTSGADLGLVYGRRRQGKSHLLSALCEIDGGFYFEAAEATTEQNLTRFGREFAVAHRLSAPVTFESWEAALAATMRSVTAAPAPVVIDEFNYLVAADPTLPSTVQRLFGPRADTRRRSEARLILCGSAFTTMAGLLAGTAPLRGRASLELLVEPFDYLTAARFWGMDRQPDAALAMYALLGGTPAYRGMSRAESPRSLRDLPRWASEHLLHPASALFREGRVIVDEDPELRDRALSWAVLSAIAGGASTRSDIARAVGRDATALSRPLALLTAVGLVVRDADLLRQRRGRYRIAEPMVATHQLLIAPNERRLQRGQGIQVWNDNEALLRGRLFADTFERVAREWLERQAIRVLGHEPTAVGATTVGCRGCAFGQHAHQVDVIAVDRDAAGRTTVMAIGEAKWRARPVERAEVDRLGHIRDALGRRAAAARLLLFSRSGFTADCERAARGRDDIHLVEVAELYAD